MQIAYLSESQFPHLQKGYDNTNGHGTVMRIKRIPFHSRSGLKLLSWGGPISLERMPHYQFHHYQPQPQPGAGEGFLLKRGCKQMSHIKSQAYQRTRDKVERDMDQKNLKTIPHSEILYKILKCSELPFHLSLPGGIQTCSRV